MAHRCFSMRRFLGTFLVLRGASSFHVSSPRRGGICSWTATEFIVRPLAMVAEPAKKIDLTRKSSTSAISDTLAKEGTDEENVQQGQAIVGTVNERLIAELEEASKKEKYGSRSSVGKKLGLDAFRFSTKTDEERQAAIEEARNLNGVNPLVTGGGSVFALAVALGLWYATTFLGVWFASHPVNSDIFFITRTTAVFRNVVVGLVSLASGFFGVTGLGILLLTFRVAYGVATGELDPTPIRNNSSSKQDEVEFDVGSVWDLMSNKKKRPRDDKK